MSDEGKSAAIRELRQQVGFGCPVCRSPFLTWHHFDPPVHETGMHWRTEGIVAMCPFCHADADEKGGSAGAYSKDELRAMKESSHSSEDVKGRFPAWEQKKSLLVRMGGCYADTHSPLFSINGIPQIVIGKNEAGLLNLSFTLRNRQDQVLLRMEENWLTAYPANVHDMIVPPKTKRIKVWLDKEDVGLDLSFKRVTVSELDQLLSQDRERAIKIATEKIPELFGQMLPIHRKSLEQDLPLDSEDPIGTHVKCWAKRHCVMDDGLIPLLDFEQMAIYHHGERLTIKNGVAGFLYYCAAFNNQKGAINIHCPCPTCSPQTEA